MASLQTEIESKVLELATESLAAFCEDISGMFGVEMGCEQQEISTETVAQMKKRFRKLAAVNIVDCEGILNGTFQLIIDQEGLFTLGGVMVMLPEERILANRKGASADLAESMVDAVREAGTLLVGAWERIFREGLEGHGRFLQRLPAFVGKPWDKPEEEIALASDQELVYIPYETTIAPYPAFQCGVIFPKKLFEGESNSDFDDAAQREEDSPEEAKTGASGVETTSETSYFQEPQAEEAEPAQPGPEEKPKSETPAEKTPVGEDKAEQTEGPEATEKEPKPAKTGEDPALGPVSEAIKEMARSSASPDESVIPGPAKNAAPGRVSELLWIRARDIMQRQVVWVSPEDSVQQALTKLQQNDIGYLVVGHEEVLEGIVSKADVAGAVSPYLRPIFGKWCRPSDGATLQIKLKWIMSRPVRTARPDTPLSTILENMCRFSGRALPVVDEQGNVQGLVTAFDIFQMLLNAGADVSTVGKAPQGPPL